MARAGARAEGPRARGGGRAELQPAAVAAIVEAKTVAVTTTPTTETTNAPWVIACKSSPTPLAVAYPSL